MRRIILVFLVVPLLGAVAVSSAAADPVGTPAASPTFTVTCELNGQQTTFQVVGTGKAGHELDGTGILVLFAATRRTFVNGALVDEVTFNDAARAVGLPVSTCAAFAEFQNDQGQTVRIELTNARILVTPPA